MLLLAVYALLTLKAWKTIWPHFHKNKNKVIWLLCFFFKISFYILNLCLSRYRYKHIPLLCYRIKIIFTCGFTRMAIGKQLSFFISFITFHSKCAEYAIQNIISIMFSVSNNTSSNFNICYKIDGDFMIIFLISFDYFANNDHAFNIFFIIRVISVDEHNEFSPVYYFHCSWTLH